MKLFRSFFFFAWMALFAGSEIHGAFSIAISPAAPTRNYKGELTYSIAGFPPGSAVVVDRFADLNANGIIDAGDVLVRRFAITDGQRMRFDGTANLNVPGDIDEVADGAITSKTAMGIDPIVNRQSGKYLVRATVGEVSAVTPFEILAPVFPQLVIGQVKNSVNNEPVPFAWIVALIGDGAVAGSVRADASGNYALPVDVGPFSLLPVADGFVGSFNEVNLQAGQDLNLSLPLTPAELRISGHVATDAGAAVPTTFVLAQLGNEGSGLIAGGLSDASGNYSFAVTPGSWEVQPMPEFASQLGLLVRKDRIVTNVTAAATIDFVLPRATALIHGRIADQSGAPIGNLEMRAHSQNDPRLEAAGRTSALGDYYLAVGPGSWDIESEGADLNGFLNVSAQVSLNANEAVAQSFTLLKYTAQLRGRAIDTQGNGISNIQLVAFQESNGNSDETGDDGSFTINLFPGHWKLQVAGPAPAGFLAPSLEFDLAEGQHIDNIQFVLLRADATISGFVRTPTGAPVSGIVIRPSALLGGVLYFAQPATSQADGSFTVQAGRASWFMNLDCSDLQTRFFQCPNTANANTTAGSTLANITLVPLTRPKIESPIFNNSDDFRFTLRGDPGTYGTYGATSATAASGDWTFVGSVTINNQGVGDGHVNPSGNRFFQVRRQ